MASSSVSPFASDVSAPIQFTQQTFRHDVTLIEFLRNRDSMLALKLYGAQGSDSKNYFVINAGALINIF